MAFCLFFPLLFVLHFVPSIAADHEANAGLVEELRHAQASSPDGVIRFDDHSVRRFVQQPESRPYSFIIFFDALQLRDNSNLQLEELRREFGILATSFVKTHQGKESASRVFFVDIEFQRSQASFALFQVSTLPQIKHLPPGNVAPKDAESIDPSELSRKAEGMAAFVESKTKEKVGPIERPPLLTKKQLIVLAGGLLVAAPFVIKRIMTKDSPLHNPKVWCSFVLFVYFFSVSGAMHNVIRKMPFMMTDRSNPSKLVFFFQGSGMQLGAEGSVVAFLYTVVGLLLAFITHFLIQLKNLTAQRIIMFVSMIVCFWAVRKVIYLDNWKTGYGIHGYWPRRWR